MNILKSWYQLTSPPELEAHASFSEREVFRRGRTDSQISIFLFLLIFISFSAAFSGSNSLLAIILILSLLSLMIAMALNRFKMVNSAGVMVVLGVIAGPVANILTTPGDLNVSALPLFGFLVLPLMCAVSFLPPRWVFVVAVANILFTVYALQFVSSTGELHAVLKVAFPGIVTPIILSQWVVAVVAFLWVRGTRRGIARTISRSFGFVLLAKSVDMSERSIV